MPTVLHAHSLNPSLFIFGRFLWLLLPLYVLGVLPTSLVLYHLHPFCTYPRHSRSAMIQLYNDHHKPVTLHLHATSGRVWHLTHLHSLSSNVTLSHDASNPSIKYALKTLKLPTDDAIKLAVADAAIWRQAYQVDATNILHLHDLVVRPPYVYYIMEYCPGGSLSGTRPEPSALRCIAAIASAIDILIMNTDQTAHANLSTAHVFLDATATPKLAGWGLSRARRLQNPNRTLTERDDVRALVAILYEMLYGIRYDPSNPLLPDDPPLSSPTVALITGILFQNSTPVPELMVFRYHIAAARKLIPPTSFPLTVHHPTPKYKPALAHSENSLSKNIQQLSSLGLQPAPQHSSPVASSAVQTAGKHSPPSPAAGAASGHPASKALMLGLTSDDVVNAMVRQITNGDIKQFDMAEVQKLIDASSQFEKLPEKIFAVFFKLPISKNPIVAFKVITLIHHLIAEGHAALTLLAITNDRFLAWVESSWSRDRIQNKTGKTHMYTYCFGTGEISWYAAAMRKRIEIHRTFSRVFSTHWVARLDGLPELRTSRRDAFRLVLDIVEKCSALLRKIVSSKDPAACVKQGAVPVLVAELSKTYLVICWLYATAEKSIQPDMAEELAVAHNATKSALDTVKSVPNLSANCSPDTLLKLAEHVAQSFDVPTLTSALRKLKKKRKKKVPCNDGEASHEKKYKKPASDDENEDNGNKRSELGARERAREQSGTPESSTGKYKGLGGERVKSRVEKPRERAVSHVVEKDRPGMDSANGRRMEVPSRNRRRLDREQHPRKEPMPFVRDPDAERPPGPEYKSRGSMRSKGRTARSYNNSDLESPQSNNSMRSDSTESRFSILGSQDRSGTSQGLSTPSGKGRNKSSRTKYRSQDDAPSDSDEGQASGKSPLNLSRGGTPEKRNGSNRSQGSQKMRDRQVDEHRIPFDREHPEKSVSSKQKKKEDKVVYIGGGSKAAIDAADKGKKTPAINTAFEVQPFEVTFGNQIGSGGFGVVFRAKFRSETVAVKKIHSHALSNPASVSEFQSEVAVLCTLRHPNILRFVGACTKPPNLMIITEYMSNGTLFDVLHQSDMRVPWSMRKKFALDTCKGMRYLHDSRLLHRDLKSSNLMLDKDYNCKVGDFGLTRTSKGAAAMQMTGQCGTFQYMAVEVLANKPYSEKADVFSFGILLWEMVARKLPYFGMQPMQVGVAVTQQGLRPTIPPKCPIPLTKLMRACWDSDPSRRPSFAHIEKVLGAMPD